jgi:hypothetical protein
MPNFDRVVDNRWRPDLASSQRRVREEEFEESLSEEIRPGSVAQPRRRLSRSPPILQAVRGLHPGCALLWSNHEFSAGSQACSHASSVRSNTERNLDTVMWRPETWNEIEALKGQAEETPILDFKRQITKNPETAKDIAAMTVNGGVIIYGVDEDKASRTASEITPFKLAGQEEKIRQVAGSLIVPTPDFDVEPLASPDDETTGVIVVVVRPSALAPHQVGGRYPCRRGTTTDSLEEAEVQRLYRQRRLLSGSPTDVEDLLEEFRQAPGTPLPLDDIDVGAFSLVVRTASNDVTHPAGAWQQGALKAAVSAAAQRQAGRLANSSLVRGAWNAITDWEPLEVDGWFANQPRDPLSGSTDKHFSATLTYPARLSFLAQYALTVPDGQGGTSYKVAREDELAYELIALLAMAGEYFSEVDGGGHLLTAIWLRGFNGAESQVARQRRWSGGLPSAPDGVKSDARVSAIALRDEPERVARRLIERWLPAFYRDVEDPPRDLFELIVPTRV